MKRLNLFTSVVFLFTAVILEAQKPVVVYEDSILFGNRKYPGFTVTIPDVNYEKTLTNWIKELEAGTKSKVMTENGEMTIFGAIKKVISLNPVNVYSKLINQDTVLILAACFETKKDVYVEPSSGDIQLTATRNYMKEFAKTQYVNLIKDELMAEEKTLRGLENDLNKLENTSSRTKKGAQRSKSTIKDEQERLLAMNNELIQLSDEIIVQNNQLIAMEAGPDKDVKATQVQELEKRKKKLQNDIDTAGKRISQSKSQIEKADKALPKNESEQEKIKDKIRDQEEVVRNVTQKLNTVKAY